MQLSKAPLVKLDVFSFRFDQKTWAKENDALKN